MLSADNPQKLLLLLTLALPMAACDGAEPAEPAEPAQPTLQADPEAAQPAAAEEFGEDPEGRWRKAPKREVTDEMMEQLAAIGYLDGYEPAPEVTGITRFDAEKIFDGYNLYVSGHGNEATLIDMAGRVLHTWTYDFAKAFPDITEFHQDNGHQYWRRAHLYDNGDLLAVHEGLGILRLDKDSNLKWAAANGAHHHMQVMDDGQIYVLTRTLEKNHEGFKKPIWHDAVTVMGADGSEVKKVSILKAAQRSGIDEVTSAIGEKGDLFHTNSIEVLDGRAAALDPAFKAGNVLLSSRTTNLIMVLDMEAEKIVWAKSGSWKKQHDAFMIGPESMIIFDNNTREQKKSAVIVIHPITGEEQWAYRGTPDEKFFTQSCGANQRLDNGNTLIIESNFGRAFEVTDAGEIVWEFINPRRAGTDGELIATLFDVDRVPKSFNISWASTAP